MTPDDIVDDPVELELELLRRCKIAIDHATSIGHPLCVADSETSLETSLAFSRYTDDGTTP